MALRRRQAEAGTVLVVVLMVMLGLLALGVTAMWLTTGNLQIGSSINQRTQALYVAEAGVERVREILVRISPGLSVSNTGVTPSNLLVSSNPTCAAFGASDEIPSGGSPDGIGAIVMVPDNDPDVAARGKFLCGIKYPDPTSPLWQRSGQIMGTYTVWLRNDAAELRQAAAIPALYTQDNNGAVVVRSRGVAADGRTTVVLEVTLGPNLGAPPSPNMPRIMPPEVLPGGKNANAANSGVAEGVVGN
jgi:hypothetical protein